jgi:hypothetical protein
MEYKEKVLLEKNVVMEDDEEMDEETGEMKQKAKSEEPLMLDFTT